MVTNTKHTPLVSVAVITYNQKEFIRACIDSVLAQDYQNLELVIADDCSTDGTQAILAEYQDKYPDKVVLKLAEKNQGITHNSNLAHFACTGKYIAWMGGDDVMLPGKISSQVDVMERNDEANICYHDLDVFNSETDQTLHKFSQVDKPRTGTLKTLVKYGAFNGACATMVRRSATPTHGFDVRIPIASDWLYWVQSLYSGGEIIYIDAVLARYRRHKNNVTGSATQVPIKNLQDHLASSTYILADRPELVSEIKFRQSQLMRSLRNYNARANYKNFLIASLKLKFNMKSLVGLLAYYCGVFK